MRGGDRQHRKQGVGLHPGEPPIPVGLPEQPRPPPRALQSQERPRLARRDSQPLAGVLIHGGEAGGAVEPTLRNAQQQWPHLRLQTLLEGHRTAQTLVELEGIRALETDDQRCEEGRKLRLRCGRRRWHVRRAFLGRGGRAPPLARLRLLLGTRHRHPGPRTRLPLERCDVRLSLGLATAPVRAPVCRWPRRDTCLSPRAHRARETVERRRGGLHLHLEWQRREHLRGDRLHAAPDRERLTRHTPRELARLPPPGAHGGRAAELYRLGLLLGRAVLVGGGGARLEGSRVHRAHLAGEGARRLLACEGDPERLVIGIRHAAEKARLRPGELALHQRRLDTGKAGQGGVHPSQILQRARGVPGAFDGVVAQASEAEPLPGARRHQPARHRSQRPPQRTASDDEPSQFSQLGVRIGAGRRELDPPTRLQEKPQRQQPPQRP